MNNIRILTSTSLFDGHDASINIMRRVLQEKGAEIIHFGHNRSAQEIVLQLKKMYKVLPLLLIRVGILNFSLTLENY